MGVFMLAQSPTKGVLSTNSQRIFPIQNQCAGNFAKIRGFHSNLEKTLWGFFGRQSFAFKTRFDRPCYMVPSARPGMPRRQSLRTPQDRKIATVRKCLWVPPIPCPDIFHANSFFLRASWLLKE